MEFKIGMVLAKPLFRLGKKYNQLYIIVRITDDFIVLKGLHGETIEDTVDVRQYIEYGRYEIASLEDSRTAIEAERVRISAERQRLSDLATQLEFAMLALDTRGSEK